MRLGSSALADLVPLSATSLLTWHHIDVGGASTSPHGIQAYQLTGAALDYREFLVLRRAFDISRSRIPAGSRIIFQELGVLSILSRRPQPVCHSYLAAATHASSATIGHRLRHLGSAGLVVSSQNPTDRRQTLLSITDEGEALLTQVCTTTVATLAPSGILGHVALDRLPVYYSAMSALPIRLGDLILMILRTSDEASLSVADLTYLTGCVQPSVTMSLQRLQANGLVTSITSLNKLLTSLSDEGTRHADGLVGSVSSLVIPRGCRGSFTLRPIEVANSLVLPHPAPATPQVT